MMPFQVVAGVNGVTVALTVFDMAIGAAVATAAEEFVADASI